MRAKWLKSKWLKPWFYASDRIRIRNMREFTLSDHVRLRSLMNQARRIELVDVPGDYVECGAYKGGGAALLSCIMDPARRIWLYDSFEGMPTPGDHDGPAAVQYAGACRAAQADAVEALSRAGLEPRQYKICPGFFAESFQKELPEKVAFLHCDADWYDSVALVLETFYDRVSDGGCIVMDDFGHWEGCRSAFYDFCARRNIKPLLERSGYTQAYWIKGKESNR